LGARAPREKNTKFPAGVYGTWKLRCSLPPTETSSVQVSCGLLLGDHPWGCMEKADEHFRWGTLVVGCARQLSQHLALPVPFVDVEVIPPFDGSPDGISVWFICARRVQTPSFRTDSLAIATTELRKALLSAGLPATGAASLRTAVTSLEDIEAGGGRFAYFR
jgi:hypothetical protein